jgi:hypothetical protein
MVSLLTKWQLRFLVTTVVKKEVWKTDVDNISSWLPERDLVIGVETRECVSKLDSNQRIRFYQRARQFFMVVNKKLIRYFPFENNFLKAARFLSPSR